MARAARKQQTAAGPTPQRFSDWDGSTPFFGDAPLRGRRAYVVVTDESGAFIGYGVVRNTVYFIVRGDSHAEHDRFVVEMVEEGAKVIPGAPPFDTNSAGDLPPGSGTPKG